MGFIEDKNKLKITLSISNVFWIKNFLLEPLQNSLHTFFRKQVKDISKTIHSAKFRSPQRRKLECVVLVSVEIKDGVVFRKNDKKLYLRS